MGFCLPKKALLRQRSEFALVREEGVQVRGRFFSLGFRASLAQAQSRVGVITTRKLGKAHERVRLRRHAKEFFRLHQHELLRLGDIVLVPRREAVGAEPSKLREELIKLCKKAGLLGEVGSSQ